MKNTEQGRARILHAAQQIVDAQGALQLSIRAVAAACQLSVGSIYNYYPTKAALVNDLVEDFWATALRGLEPHPLSMGGFLDCFLAVYLKLQEALAQKPPGWLDQLLLLQASESPEALAESEGLGALRLFFLSALAQDPAISPDLWDDLFTWEAFVEFALTHLLAMVRTGQPDCDYFSLVLRKVLYQ